MSDLVEPQPPKRSKRARRRGATDPVPDTVPIRASASMPSPAVPSAITRDAARRRRTRLVRFIALLAVVLLGANLAVLATGAADDDDGDDLSLDFTGEDDRLDDRTDDRTDESFGGTTTSVPPAIVAVPDASVTTVPGDRVAGDEDPAGDGEAQSPTTTTTEAPEQTTTTTALDDCLDRNDPACGPFRYEPEPGPNAPLEISISVDPPSPVVGDDVIITVAFTDADGVPVTNCGGFDTGEGIPIQDDCAVPVCAERFGPTSPPAPQGGTRFVTIPHVYEQPGTYNITASGQSNSVFCDHPYGSSAVARVPVAVGAAP